MIETQEFRKKPFVIEAVQLTPGNMASVAKWCVGRIVPPDFGTEEHTAIAINTLEGTMLAEQGDWIIKGVAGEFYPCKPDIFEATYERAEPTSDDEIRTGGLPDYAAELNAAPQPAPDADGDVDAEQMTHSYGDGCEPPHGPAPEALG
jgi:hypothetical protein